MADEETPRYDDEQVDVNNEQLQELNELFSRFKDDPDADYINVYRLTEVLQAFGRNPSLKDSEERIQDFENEGKTELTFGEFLDILNEQWTIVNNDRDALRQALEKFDDNHEGFIDIERFRTVLTTLGEPLSDDDLEVLIQLGVDEQQTKISIDYLLDQLLGPNV